MSDDIFPSILEVAIAAAREAGALMIAQRGGGAGSAVESTKASFQDLVTATDKACEAAICARVSRAFPDHAILGEESVAPGRAASAASVGAALARAEFVWVVDPIDGTTNFVSSIPLSAVSIGVARRGVVVVGVIYEPYRDELFHAVRGGGAWLNGARVRAAAPDDGSAGSCAAAGCARVRVCVYTHTATSSSSSSFYLVGVL